ncbi:MAG: DUF302 domain-containing protein [Parvularculaceae bacterium]
MRSLIAALMIAAVTACAHAEAPAAPQVATAEDGLVAVSSNYGVDETVSRLEAALAKRGVKVMAKIDHAANAAGAGLQLPPTMLVIFGNPAAGTQLMLAERTAGIDLPMKALVYEEGGETKLVYNDPGYIARRHGISADAPVLSKMSALLAAVAAEATAGE